MSLPVRIQARVTLPEALRARIDAVRMRWNPEVATGNPAHFTIVYHDEAPDPAVLRARLAHACQQVSPFVVHLDGVARFPEPDRGAFLAVQDPSGGVAALRRLVLSPPCTPRQRFGLHVTLLHPGQGERLAQAWPELSAVAGGASFRVEHVELISSSGPHTRTLASLALAASAPFP